MAVTVIYCSIPQRHVAERATREAIGNRAGDWTVCLVEPPHQRLWVIVVDGPNGFAQTWIFDDDDKQLATVRNVISRDLGDAGY